MKKNHAFVKRLMAATMATVLCATMAELPVNAGSEQSDKNTVADKDGENPSKETEESKKDSAGAFDPQDISSLYNNQKLSLSMTEQIKAEYNKQASGLLVSGNAADMKENVFTFADEFDFSDGTIGRIDVNALAEKGSSAKIAFYLDDSETPFAQIDPAKQKRAKKWYTKVMTTSVMDQKITGKHKVSFKIVPGDGETTTGMLLRTITFAKSTIPVISFNIDETKGSIDAMNGDSGHDTECYGDMKVEIPSGYTCEYTSEKGKTDNLKTATYPMEYIRGRGNSTWGNAKNPYKIKLDKKENLFNMGKNKHWVLLADYYDPSHIRNKITYWMGKKLGMPYTPEGVYVDVVMNGQYYGSYMLCEQVRVGKSRVDIDDLEADDASKAATDGPTITGGYLLGMSPYGDKEQVTFKTKRGTEFELESPSFEDYENEAQYNYIKNYVQDTEDAIYGKEFKNNGKSYADYMDVDSAVDYYWMQEFSMNGDAFGSTSTYLYKPRNGKLCWGPLWDFDYVAWGNNEYDEYNCEDWSLRESAWFGKLFRDKTFTEKMISRWADIRKVMEEASKDGGQIDQYADEIRSSMKYNDYLFGNNYDADNNDKTFEQSVEQLKGWIKARTKWVDENVNTLQAKCYQVRFMDGKKVLSSQEIFEGDHVELPKAGRKKGYVFAGWYAKDGEYSYRVDKTSEVYEDMTIYAKWVRADKVKPVSKIVLGYKEKVEAYYAPDTEDNDSDVDINTTTIPYRIIGGAEGTTELVWKSSNAKIVKPVGDGEFQILGVGTATVTASTKDGKVKASCKIRVVDGSGDDIYAEGFTLSRHSVKLKKGDYTVLKPDIYPSDCTEFLDVQYYCEDPAVEIETVGSNCIVRGAKDGTAQITAFINSEYGTSLQICKVQVGKASAKEVKPGSKAIAGGIVYKVTSITAKGGTVKAIGLSNAKKTSVKISATITIAKKKYAVTAVAPKAFKGNKKLKSVVFGANVKKVGTQAFTGCKNLKSLQFKSGNTKFGKQAFAKTAAKVKLKAKKADRKTYLKRLKKAGVKKIAIAK